MGAHCTVAQEGSVEDLAAYDGLGLAELVRNKDVTPLELVERAIRAIERLNPSLNAVVTLLADRARAAAVGPLPNGPFRGVPFLVKDLLAGEGGVRHTSGSAFLRDVVAPHDAELIRRYKRAGLVIVGRTNTPEFGLLPTTEPHLHGPTRNPWDPTRSSGGSSGGSAAAVAARLVPMAHGNDGGGSIRIPASCCGVFGLKPTRARNPLGPDFGEVLNGLVAEHAITRSVRDSAALLDATAGSDVGDPYWAPPPARPFLAEVGVPPGRLRIACTTATLDGAPVDEACRRAVLDAAQLCADLGHVVEDAAPPLAQDELTPAFLVLWTADTAATLDAESERLGRTPRADEIEPLTRALADVGRGHSAPGYLRAVRTLQEASRVVARFFRDYDVWLTPTLAEPPLPLGSFESPDNPAFGMFRAASFVPFTPVANMTGQPAMSVPLAWHEGLPIGSHFVGRFGEEAMLFRLAAQLEDARPWRDRKPPISV
jgi:amidase